MLDIIDELNEIDRQQISAVFCLVTGTSGSTPRKAGSKMLVFADGSIKGTIGGGSIEHQVIDDAVKMLCNGSEPVLKQFNLKDDLNMECGGSMQVYLEPLGCQPRLYIFGGGHIGKALAGYAAGLGFRPLVIDQREDIFQNWDVQKTETRTGDYLQVIDSLNFDKQTYIVIVTPQHAFDEQVLVACLPREYAYLGMIGSRRKVAEISRRAEELYHISPDLLKKVDMPVGIPFAAETPAEIAISIVAKLIDVKNTLKK